jgi:muramoyltetrapeptide carboxypeptidase
MRREKQKPSKTDRWIGITAPSTLLNPKLLEKSLERFAQWGYPVRMDDSIFEKFRYFAGTDENRAQSLLRLLRDPSVGTIWCARGGYGATRILKKLDAAGAPKLMARDPKLLFGFSDVTALHLYFYHHLKLPSVHSPMPAGTKWPKMPARTDRILQSILKGRLPLGTKSHTADWKGKPLYLPGKKTTGVILGGNLSMLVSLLGTPWQPDLKGAFLFLEDCGEAPYRVDRMLTQLENAGMLKGLRGVLLGDFEADVIYREPAEKKYWKEVLLERFADRKIPVLSGLPVGHGKYNEPLPLGVRAEITARGRLFLLEQPVKS